MGGKLWQRSVRLAPPSEDDSLGDLPCDEHSIQPADDDDLDMRNFRLLEEENTPVMKDYGLAYRDHIVFEEYLSNIRKPDDHFVKHATAREINATFIAIRRAFTIACRGNLDAILALRAVVVSSGFGHFVQGDPKCSVRVIISSSPFVF